MKKNIIEKVLSFICISGFVLSVFFLGKYYFNSKNQKEKFERIESIVFEESESENEEVLNYNELKNQNNDCIGWITISGTRINYPVMYKKEDNLFYLDHNFQNEYSVNGVPFIDGKINKVDNKNNIIIYGHNMKDGSMFAGLIQYKDSNFYNEHKEVQLYIEYEKYTYEIFAVCLISGTYDKEIYNVNKLNEIEEFNNYIKKIKEKSLYYTNYYPNEIVPLLLLSTCEYSQEDGRIIIFAKKVE